ncbi:hypothetical protein RI129_000352 [Pyrocoelia pectoralis]|uniref:Uncharacterized protein n=1 Tax=Pyrocoelia pectoralis TaxID=417401 RepID=A0AAN7VSM3_9COLE
MFGGNEDEDLFDPSASSNLAALFGTAMTFKNDDTNLSYTAPKQPKAEKQEVTTSLKVNTQSTVICSNFVNVFKQIDGQYVGQGKCGIAIIGVQSLNAYELILYKSKQDIISRSRLTIDFTFKIQNSNFANFSNDQQEQWSVHFDSNELEAFAIQLESHDVRIVRLTTSNSLPDTSTTKESILSRMAKMGQSILPTPPKIVDSESDDTDTMLKRTKRKQKHTSASGELQQQQPDFALVNSRTLPQQQTIPNQFIQFSQTPDMFNIFLAENRTHNCEMRMNMLQLSTKLDKIMEEVANGSRPVHSHTSRRDSAHDDLLTRSKQYEAILKENSDEINKLKQENTCYKETVAEQELKIANFEDAANDCSRLRKTVEEHVDSIKNLESREAEQQTKIKSLTELCNNRSKEVEELNVKLAGYFAKHELFSTNLKHNMNTLYQTLMNSFKDENVTFSTSQIQQILASNLRTTTSTIIKEFCNNFDIHEKDS